MLLDIAFGAPGPDPDPNPKASPTFFGLNWGLTFGPPVFVPRGFGGGWRQRPRPWQGTPIWWGR